MDTRFECLIKFTKGQEVSVGDHKWVPIAHGVVAHIYRNRDPVEKDILEAAQEAGRILNQHACWGVP